MASVNVEIMKAIKELYAKLKPKKTNETNPDQYLTVLRYPEGPSVWNQKWEIFRKRA